MSTPSTAAGEFTAWDYVVFVLMLVTSALIGIYQAIKARGQHSNVQYLLGNRQLRALPVALSLASSFMSAITVIGTPAEVYRFGAMFLIFCFTYAIVITVSAEFFLPVFYRLNITSTYEYLLMRYNKIIRYIGTCFFITQTVLYTGIVIYAPALALNQVTGFDLWGVLVSTGLVCTFYCTMGGLKAVVWTDVFQLTVMILGFVAVIIRGAVIHGSFAQVLNISYHGGRLNFWDFDPSPIRRHTFWTIVVGGTFVWTAIYGINQSQVQRYIACRSQFEAKLSSPFVSIVILFLNCPSPHAVTWRLMLAQNELGNWHARSDMRLYITQIYQPSTFSSVFQAALTIFGILGGPLLGVFLLGMVFRWANSIGALAGLGVSFLLTLWIGIGGHVYRPLPTQTRPLPLSTAGCLDIGINTSQAARVGPYLTTHHAPDLTSRPAIADTLYSISYLYLSPIGTVTVVIVGLIVSLLTGGKQNVVDKKLLMTYKDTLCYTYYVNRSLRSLMLPPRDQQDVVAKEELEAIADTEKVTPIFTDQEPTSTAQEPASTAEEPTSTEHVPDSEQQNQESTTEL
ncbi:sodium-coupled monocarboxylate transporter 1-like [Rhincodon typus]|uniref:sodium-coupled monocarboxylate transporter 1-like n=1 Tax=Rhincodon typus TaxID=259920 RepID=UPI00203085CB|nr:sodium-coupled monocarboxylate transporter 1-like [Rhincodon typus]